MKRIVLLLIFFVCLGSAIVIMFLAVRLGRDSDQSSEWLEKALQTERFIAKGRMELKNGIGWKVMPDSLESSHQQNLYSGSPGVILFYLELYNQTEDEQFLTEAKLGADQLIVDLSDVPPSSIGLYTGLAGIAYTLQEVYHVTKETKYLEGQQKAEYQILSSSSGMDFSSSLFWDGTTDIVYGSAGVGSFFLKKRNDPDGKSVMRAIRIAQGLMDSVMVEEDGNRWRLRPGYERYLDNFSHGTAGVAFYLAEVYQKLGMRDMINTASKGAEFVQSISNEKGYASHHFPDGEDLYYLSWCHGPAGTSQMYYSLYESTGEKKWMDTILSTADNLMNEGLESKETPGFWNNHGKCCGGAGVAEYYAWLYDVSGDQKYLDYAKTMAQSVIEKGQVRGDTLLWVHAENRVSPEMVAAQTGLMQGSAGIGLMFLKMHSYSSGVEFSIQLPDHN